MSIVSEEAWEVLSAQLRRFIARRVGEADAVDDIVQEVLLRIYRGGEALEQAEQMYAWIYQIARNTIADHYRAQGRQTALTTALTAAAPAEEQDASESTVRTELAACLAPMLTRLPATSHEALVLTEVEGLTQQAAAVRLGLSVPGAKSRVQRARRQLKDMLLACCRVELDRRGGIVAYEARDRACRGCRAEEAPKARLGD